MSVRGLFFFSVRMKETKRNDKRKNELPSFFLVTKKDERRSRIKTSAHIVLLIMVDVTTINPATVFAWFMLGMLLRRFVLIAIFNVSIRGRPLRPGTRVPEDAARSKRRVDDVTPETQPIEFSTDERVNKTITNDSENDTYFLILLLATAVFSDTATGSATRTIVYGVIYLVVRVMYAVAYLRGLQPWRTILFAMGLTCTAACNLDLIITLSRRAN